MNKIATTVQETVSAFAAEYYPYVIGALVFIGVIGGGIGLGKKIFGDATAASARWTVGVALVGLSVAVAVALTTSDNITFYIALFFCLNMIGGGLGSWEDARNFADLERKLGIIPVQSSGTATMIARGFHRIGVFLAGLILLAGIAATVLVGIQETNAAAFMHQKLVCARDKFRSVSEGRAPSGKPDAPNPEKPWLSDAVIPNPPPGFIPDETQDLQKLGCTTWPENVSVRTALNEGDGFSWFSSLWSSDAPIILAVTIGLSLAVYLLVRAIGWVVAGFTSS